MHGLLNIYRIIYCAIAVRKKIEQTITYVQHGTLIKDIPSHVISGASLRQSVPANSAILSPGKILDLPLNFDTS